MHESLLTVQVGCLLRLVELEVVAAVGILLGWIRQLKGFAIRNYELEASLQSLHQ